jgi:hypothetical protein
MRPVAVFAAISLAASALVGCAAVSVVDTAASVTSTVVETAVDVTAGAVDAVAGPSSKSDEKPDCADKDKDKDVCKKAASDKAAPSS